MLCSKLINLSLSLREKAATQQPMTADGCAMLALCLEDLAERVAKLEGQPVPPAQRSVPALRVVS